MKKLSILLVFLGFAAAASAQTVPVDGHFEEFRQNYNNQTDEVPGFVGSIVGGETVNVNFQDNNSTETVGVKFEVVEIQNISDSGYGNFTLEVNVTETAVESVIDSEQPYQELRNQLDEENIEYETKTVSSGVKLKIFETLGNLASMIGLSF